MSVDRTSEPTSPDGTAALGSEARAAWLIARTELVRFWRRSRASPARRQFYGAVGVLLYAAFGGVVSLLFTAVFLAGDGPPDLAKARTLALGITAMSVTLIAYTTVKRIGSLDGAAGTLTATTPRAAALGQMVAAYGRALAYHGLFLLAGVAGFWLVTDDALAAVVLAVVLLAGLALAVTAGFAAGMAARRLAMRSLFVARHRGVLGATVGLLAVAGYAVALGADSLDPSVAGPLLALPPAWLADLALVGMSTVRPAPFRLLGAAGLLAVGTPLFAALGTRLSARVWLGSSRRPGGGPVTERTGTPLVESLLAGRVPAPTLQAARKAWLRSRRSPVALLSGLSPYLVPAVFAVQFGTEGRPPAWTMYGFAGAGVAATGTLFALNPIGDEERVLPVTLTSVADWRAFLAGLVLVSWAVGVPLTVGVTVAVGLATGVDPSLVIAAALFAGALGVAAPGLALAAGVEYPSFETESLPGGPEVVEPSFAALVAMLAVAGLAASPLVLTVALGGHGRILVTASGLLSVVLAVLAGRAGFRYAVERFDGYVPSREQL